MRIKKSILVSVMALGFTCLGATPLLASDHHETKVRWDIIQITPSGSSFTVTPGGISTSVAAIIPAQGTGDNSTITLKESKGTFEPGEPHEVTGGGKWETVTPTSNGGTVTVTGTYQVTELLFWKKSGGSKPPAIIDGIGNPADVVTGLAILRVKYSDGEDGIIVVSCSFGPPGDPAAMFEGTTATKGVVDYFEAISVNGLDGNTFFHLMQEEDD